MKKQTVHLIVDLRDAKEVENLKARVKVLEEKNAELQAFAKRCEFNLVCQQKINLQLADYCQAAGYRIPKRLFTLWPGE